VYLDPVGQHRIGGSGKNEMNPIVDFSGSKGFEYSKLVLMKLAIADTQQIWKRESVHITLRGISRRYSATHVKNLADRYARPIGDLTPGEFRYGKNPERASTRTLNDGFIVQADQPTAVLNTKNVTKVVNGEDEP